MTGILPKKQKIYDCVIFILSHTNPDGVLTVKGIQDVGISYLMTKTLRLSDM